MPKRRNLEQEQIESFIKEVNTDDTQFKDPNAPRTFKTISLPLNAYEYDQLEKGSQKTKRSKLNFIRFSILEKAKDII